MKVFTVFISIKKPSLSIRKPVSILAILLIVLSHAASIFAGDPLPDLVVNDFEGNVSVNQTYNNVSLPNDTNVVNPYQTGINTSAHCGKLVVTANWHEMGFLIFKNPVDLSQYSGVAFKIYDTTTHDNHLKLIRNANTDWWLLPSNIIADIAKPMSTKNQWVADTINFSAFDAGINLGFAIQPRINGTYYIDDVVLIGKKNSTTPPLASNIVVDNFDDTPAVTSVYNIPYNADNIVISNPFQDAGNNSAKCSKLVVTDINDKINLSGFIDSVDLNLYSGVSFKIYASASPNIRMIIFKNADTNWWEDYGNNVFVEKTQVISTLNTWVADTIDFTANYGGKNFGINIYPQTNGTYYIDNIVLIAKKVVPPPPPRDGLKTFAALKRKNIGIAVPLQTIYLEDTRNDVKLINQEFNYCNADNNMKYNYIEPQKGVFDFGAMDVFVDKSLAAGRKIQGKSYVWYQSNPDWLLNGTFTRDELLDIMKNHITTTMTRYKGKITDWEVVNEAWVSTNEENNNPHPTLRKNNVWYKGIGPDYLDSAFVFAHRADPDAKLFYNDYGYEVMNEKADSVFNWIKRLKAKGIQVDGVGFQSHLGGTGYSPKTLLDQVDLNVKKWASIGMEVQISELDYGLHNTTAADFLQQAKVYRAMAKVWLDNPNLKTLIVFGLIDKESWLLNPEYGGFKQPLLFDDNLEPKLCYNGILDLLKNDTLVAPPTNLLVRKTTATSVTLDWDDPKLKYGNREFVIYMNGDSVKKTLGLTFTLMNLTPETEYTFFVKTTNDLGAQSIASNYVKGTTLKGSKVDALTKENDIIIFPNPVNKGESLTIDFNKPDDNEIALFDPSGKKIFSDKSRTQLYKFPVNSSLSGIYILKISSKSNNNVMRKVIFK